MHLFSALNEKTDRNRCGLNSNAEQVEQSVLSLLSEVVLFLKIELLIIMNVASTLYKHKCDSTAQFELFCTFFVM